MTLVEGLSVCNCILVFDREGLMHYLTLSQVSFLALKTPRDLGKPSHGGEKWRGGLILGMVYDAGRKSTLSVLLCSGRLLQIGLTGRKHLGEKCDCEFAACVSEWEYVLNNSIRKAEKYGGNNESQHNSH